MFKIESYVTPILLSYVDKYVRDFNPANAQVSLWGGGVALHNLVLKPDVLQQEVSLPFTLISGRIHELLIQVPWTKIMSEPIIVTIDTIECVLNLKPPVSPDESPPPASPSHKTPVVEAPPGYMQALVRRIVSNIALRVHHLIVKYVQDDIVLSLNVKYLFIDSAAVNWEPAFADIDPNQPTVRRLVRIDDLTLCLDKADSDGKIRYYQEPLLYRCQLDLRVLTQLVSANSRRASSLSVNLRSSKLAFSVTSDQLALLLRLLKERVQAEPKQPPVTPKSSLTAQTNIQQLTNMKSNSLESTRSSNSWSEWAWSWLPTWTDKEGGFEDIPVSPTPLPLFFDAFIDDLSLVFKVMELVDGHNRKRSRGVIEVGAKHAVVKSSSCFPTSLAMRFGARDLVLRSHGKCVCGVTTYDASVGKPTMYLKRVDFIETEEPWTWPAETLAEPFIAENKVEVAQAVTEEYRASLETVPGDTSSEAVDPPPTSASDEPTETSEELDQFWVKLCPLIYVEFTHERSPPSPNMNPYDNPPKDFQYSDWVEHCRVKIKLEPVEVRLCMGLIHRVMAVRSIFKEVDTTPTELPMRVLTVEECDSLTDNLPERRMTFEGRGLRIRLIPWNHYLTGNPVRAPVVLGFDLPNTSVTISGPLYPHRVCSAACQLPEDVGPLWQGARVHVSAVVKDAQMILTTFDNTQQRPCARAYIHLVMHILQKKEFFNKRESVFISHSLKITEMSVSGSSARLQAAWWVIDSLVKDELSVVLKHSTLARDALNDEDAVVVDISLEEFICRGYITKNIKTFIVSLQSAKATALHEPTPGNVNQAWLFSAPDAPTTTPYLRLAVQWCKESSQNFFEYLGFWAEPTAVCLDPLLIAWLAYKPVMKSTSMSSTSLKNIPKGSVQRKLSWSSGVGGRGASGNRPGASAELVHIRPRNSQGSSSEPSEKKQSKLAPQNTRWWHGDALVALHRRLRTMLIHVEMGLIQVYVIMSTASAIDCVTLRDAMERHAVGSHRVLAISLGRLAMHSNSVNKHLWQELRHDGPTFITQEAEAESFPWKIRIADVSCYTLEVNVDRDISGSAPRSTLKAQAGQIHPRTVLELVTTTVTVSVVTKMVHIKNIEPIPEKKKTTSTATTEKSQKTKYFTSGVEFKPTTLKEFFRGPQRQSTRKDKKSAEDTKQETPEPQKETHKVTIKEGPVLLLGVHLHADTPPVIVKLEKEQAAIDYFDSRVVPSRIELGHLISSLAVSYKIHVVAVAIHCFRHLITLLKRDRPDEGKESNFNTLGTASGSHISFLPRSVSEQEPTQTASEESISKSSELIEIFDRSQDVVSKKPLTTFFCCQWVVSHATVIVASRTVKLAFDLDDIISTVDIQPHYNQLKIKVASASIRHYELNVDDEWMPGVLGGRVLEAREMTGTKDEDQFLAVTITQAYISQLPDSWKQELHPKLLENKGGDDIMWEIYATLAPLEAILQPLILDNIFSLIKELMPRAYCPNRVEEEKSQATWQWPFCYLSAGGVRLLITGEMSDEFATDDDTFVFTVDRVTMNPHPENPIWRRLVNAGDSSWLGPATNYEGRQYELTVRSVQLRSAQLRQLIKEETGELEKNKSNPALKWNQGIEEPTFTPLLYPLDICLVLAPALFTRGVLTCGPAVDINILTDCAMEVSIEHIVLCQKLAAEMLAGLADKEFKLTRFHNQEKHGVCPYAELLKITIPESTDSDSTLQDEQSHSSLAADSGVETVASQSISAKGRTFFIEEMPPKKSVSIAFSDHVLAPSDNFELFLTMGTVELTLYVRDDSTSDLDYLRIPYMSNLNYVPQMTPSEALRVKPASKSTDEKDMNSTSSRSLTDVVRDRNTARGELKRFRRTKENEDHIVLLQAILRQPNFYYWKRRDVKNFQVSLFDVSAGLGLGVAEGNCKAIVLSTAKGSSDPITDIPPALATLKIIAPNSSSPYTSASTAKGSIRLDVERPVQVDICADRLKRLISLNKLLMDKLLFDEDVEPSYVHHDLSPLYKLRQKFLQVNIESMLVHTSQIALCGSEGSLAWDGLSCQLAAGSRPHRVTARSLVTALVLASGPATDRRHIVLQPLMLGVELEATWEAWRRAEGGPTSRDPSICFNVEMGRVVVDLRPAELNTCHRLKHAVKEVINHHTELLSSSSVGFLPKHRGSLSHSSLRRPSATSGESDGNSHYYKDDLRSGAFKILTGGQLPMAYQILLHGNSVSWRYPHPRTITRIVAFPLPGADEETDCVLELFTSILGEWEPHTYFKIPVGEPREIQLQSNLPEAVFSSMWRFRACRRTEPPPPPFDFRVEKFQPKPNPLLAERIINEIKPQFIRGVTAEQLSGVLRVDSYFAPQALPRIKLIVQVADTEVHLHNELPAFASQATTLEGYYVSRPLMRSHRVLSFFARNSKWQARFGSSSGMLFVIKTWLSADITECATGTMEELVREFLFQAAAAADSWATDDVRGRVFASPVHVALHVSRLRTIHALAVDWSSAVNEYMNEADSLSKMELVEERTIQELAAEAATALEGRVSMWIHNSCTSALRIGQEGTDEVVPLGPGVRLAYRWRCPTAPKKLRLALADPTANWHWSPSLEFTPGSTRVKLEDPALMEKEGFNRGFGIYVHVKVEESGGKRHMHLCGRLLLANMLRFRLLYKVRARTDESEQWRTVCSDEMEAEHVGRSVLCAADAEMVLKIKFVNHDIGWSGDIPLKECPKENVPWLVKVPSEGELPYVAVWCRVVRARADGRVLAAVWPLYVLHSHLPLDTDVLIATEKNRFKATAPDDQGLAPLIQSTPGRGHYTHLLAPGTTANRHSLSFQYRNIQCPVTREAVPLHYGVTDVSVFDKRTPVMHVDEVIHDILNWLKRSSRQTVSSWPYSLVSKHWMGPWQAAMLQPRCDVTVRYRAVRAGGGCSLEAQLCPLVLLCNAAPLALTLRAHDAAPLCVLQAGAAIAPPSAILTKPFYLSVEIGRETFVSEQLQVSREEPGRYGTLPPGHVALDHAAHFSVLCNQKVALLTMYYEIKEDINVLGITATYVLINRLNIDLRVSAVAIPADNTEVHNLRAQTFKVVKPTKKGSIHGASLCRFFLRGRWRGGHPSELQKFVCLALGSDYYSVSSPVPVRLGDSSTRRAFALIDEYDVSIPITVTQIKHDKRYLIVVAYDTCPQYLVQNLTHVPICVAQPVPTPDDTPSTSKVVLSEECVGAHWWCVVPPGGAMHYSSPLHCARFPPPAPPAPPVVLPPVALLAFGKLIEDSLRVYHEWSAPVAITEGEQLLQFYGGVTVKLRVKIHPHSTHLLLKDTDEHDLSASDIRKRLHGALGPDTSALDLRLELSQQNSRAASFLDRNNAVSRLLDAPKEYDIPKHKESLVPLADNTEHLKLVKDMSKKISLPPGIGDLTLKEIKPLDLQFSSTQPSQERIKSASVLVPPVRIEETISLHDDKSKLEVSSTLEVSSSLKLLKEQDSETQEAEELNTEQDATINLLDKESLATNAETQDEALPRAGSSVGVVFADSASSKEVSFKDEVYDSKVESMTRSNMNICQSEFGFHQKPTDDDDCVDIEEESSSLNERECVRIVVAGMVVKMAATADVPPLFALHLDRVALLLVTDPKKTKAIISVADVQIENLQYETGQYDFAVVLSTRACPLLADPWPSAWNMFGDKPAFSTRYRDASVMLKVHQDMWQVPGHHHKEITELEVRLGSLALYIEDAYISALLELSRLALPPAPSADTDGYVSEERSIRNPLRLRLLYIHPLNLTLTLHTAVRMYIALDQSPLRLSAFKLHNMMTSAERLTHALTVHYLSAAILGAGWVVGGLELLGAPGAIAARLGEATGGVKGMASATAAALLRSLSAWAGSLARNLDLLAGDEDHARRAAAARRRPPTSFLSGLVTGITNFAINILGAVGGLAHHPLVGVAVGETDSSTVALRRGLLGALTKPLSATADLVAYAGHGLLKQTGWDPVLQPRSRWAQESARESAGWRRDCVRWTFRLAELHALAGFEVMLDNSPLQLLITHKYLVVADPENERIVEMIDLKSCTLAPYQGQVVELSVAPSRKSSKMTEGKATDEDDEYQISAAAMARVARYTGAEGAAAQSESRVLFLLTPPGRDHSLFAVLTTMLHQNAETHLTIL